MRRLSLWILVLMLCFVETATRAAEEPKNESIVFEGTVLRLAPAPAWVSGNTAVYRLVKYRVERVCAGRYSGAEIVVDHLVLTGKELEGVKVGDRFCVSVDKSNKIFARFNARGIREASAKVTVFYIAARVGPPKECLCDPK